MSPIAVYFSYGDVAAWGLVAAAVVFGMGVHRIGTGGAVALAALAGFMTKAVLMPLT